ncbi:MAG: hypothetical protein AAFU53_08900 [Cyanobacteria bacterium J06632_3]
MKKMGKYASSYMRSNKAKRLLSIFINRHQELSTYAQYLTRGAQLPEQRFAIVAGYRTGSTLLADLINHHPDIFCDQEIFFPFIHSRYTHIQWPYLYMQGKSMSSPRRIYGFDLKPEQIMHITSQQDHSLQRILWTMHEGGWKIIYLQRSNLVRQVISNYLAIKRQHWHDRPGEPLKRQKIVVDMGILMKMLTRHGSIDQKAQEAMVNIPHLALSYESDLLNAAQHSGTAQRVFEYLRVRSIPVKTAMKKIAASHLSDDIGNWDEVVENLSQSQYAHYLDFDLPFNDGQSGSIPMTGASI